MTDKTITVELPRDLLIDIEEMLWNRGQFRSHAIVREALLKHGRENGWGYEAEQEKRRQAAQTWIKGAMDWIPMEGGQG